MNHLDSARMIIKQGVTSPNSIKAADIINVYNEEKEKLRKYLEKLPCRFCLTIDGVGLQDYACLMVYFIDDDWKLQEKIISFKCLEENETAAKYLKNVLLQWGIDNNISSMVTWGLTDKYDMSSNERKNWFTDHQDSLPFNSKLLCVDSFNIISNVFNHFLNHVNWDLYESMSRIISYITETSSKKENFRIAIDGAKSLDKEVSAEVIPTKQELEQKFWHEERLVVGVLEIGLGRKEAFFELENIDSDFKHINLTKEEWDQIRVLRLGWVAKKHFTSVTKTSQMLPFSSIGGTIRLQICISLRFVAYMRNLLTWSNITFTLAKKKVLDS